MPVDIRRDRDRSLLALCTRVGAPVMIGVATAWLILNGNLKIAGAAVGAAVFLVVGLTRPRVALWSWVLLAPLGDRYAVISLPVGLPDVTFSRAVVAIIAMALLLRVALHGERLRPVGRVEAAAVALACVMGLDLLWRGHNVVPEVLKDFDELGIPVLLYMAARQLLTEKADMRRALSCLTVMGIYLGAHGIAQFLEFTAVGSTVQEGAVERVDAIRVNESFLGQGRSLGPFAAPIEFGAVGAICFCAALLLGLRPVRHLWSRALPFLALVPTLAAVALSAARSTWVGLVAAVVATGALERRRRAVILVTVLVVGVTAAGVIMILPQSELFVNRAFVTASIDSRAATYRVAWRLAARRPLLGHGTGEPTLRAAAAEAAVMGTVVGELASGQFHNTFLSMFIEWGIVGPIVYGALVAALLRIVLAARRRAGEGDELYHFAGFVLACWTIFLVQHLVHDTPPFHFLNGVCFLLVGLTHAQLDVRSMESPGRGLPLVA